MVKIMENILYHRILVTTGHQLTPAQHANRRGRGTELLLTEAVDQVQEGLTKGNMVYITSFDIAGAFDCVPHRQLMRSLSNLNVNGHLRRVIHNWLRERTFQARMKTETGVHLPPIHTISRGFPQGGVISPLLWIIFFNPVLSKLRRMREEMGEDHNNYKDLIYADELTCIIMAQNEELQKKRAHLLVTMVKKALKEMSLQIHDQKTANAVLSPYFLP